MRIHASRLAALAAGATLALSAAAGAASQEDQRFVEKAASDGMLEQKLGEYAAQNAANEQVKEFGHLMATDHGQANEKLKSVAQKAGIRVPEQLKPKDQAKLDELTKLKGAEFDRAYMREMVQAHEKDVKAFRQEATNPQSDVDRFAAETLPTLEAHLEQAKQIQQQVAGQASARTPPQTSSR